MEDLLTTEMIASWQKREAELAGELLILRKKLSAAACLTGTASLSVQTKGRIILDILAVSDKPMLPREIIAQINRPETPVTAWGNNHNYVYQTLLRLVAQGRVVREGRSYQISSIGDE